MSEKLSFQGNYSVDYLDGSLQELEELLATVQHNVYRFATPASTLEEWPFAEDAKLYLVEQQDAHASQEDQRSFAAHTVDHVLYRPEVTAQVVSGKSLPELTQEVRGRVGEILRGLHGLDIEGEAFEKIDAGQFHINKSRKLLRREVYRQQVAYLYQLLWAGKYSSLVLTPGGGDLKGVFMADRTYTQLHLVQPIYDMREGLDTPLIREEGRSLRLLHPQLAQYLNTLHGKVDREVSTQPLYIDPGLWERLIEKMTQRVRSGVDSRYSNDMRAWIETCFDEVKKEFLHTVEANRQSVSFDEQFASLNAHIDTYVQIVEELKHSAGLAGWRAICHSWWEQYRGFLDAEEITDDVRPFMTFVKHYDEFYAKDQLVEQMEVQESDLKAHTIAAKQAYDERAQVEEAEQEERATRYVELQGKLATLHRKKSGMITNRNALGRRLDHDKEVAIDAFEQLISTYIQQQMHLAEQTRLQSLRRKWAQELQHKSLEEFLEGGL